MTLNEVTAEPPVDAHRTLEVDALPETQPAKRRHARGFRTDVRIDIVRRHVDHGQAYPVDRQAVAGMQFGPERRLEDAAEGPSRSAGSRPLRRPPQ